MQLSHLIVRSSSSFVFSWMYDIQSNITIWIAGPALSGGGVITASYPVVQGLAGCQLWAYPAPSSYTSAWVDNSGSVWRGFGLTLFGASTNYG